MITREKILELLEGEEFSHWDEVVRLREAAVPHLIDVMKTSSEPLMIMRAARVAGEIGSVQAAPAIAELLGDSDPAVRFNAAHALWQVQGSVATAALCGLLKDPDWVVVSTAVRCLEQAGTPEAIAHLETIRLDSPHDFLRDRAAEAIRAIDKRVV